MKSKLKNSIKVLIVLVLALLSLWGLAKLCERKDSEKKYRDFYSQKEPFDVLFYGSSHIVEGVSPMYLWEEQGIVSYNLGGSNSMIPTSYWVMRNTVERHKPRLAVLDVAFADVERKTWDIEFVHILLDALPMSKTKAEAALDVTDNWYEKSLELLYDFPIYHNRWNELGREDFAVKANAEKGAGSSSLVVPACEWELLPEGKYPFAETEGTIYLRKFIEYCQENDIEVLLIKIPYPSTAEKWGTEDQIYGNGVSQIAEEYGINYINFFYEDIINYDTDLSDGNNHLNSSGARKLTAFLGEYIKKNYDIPDHRNNSRYSDWNRAWCDYYLSKIGKLNEANKLYSYLMLLYNPDFYSEIQIDSVTRVDRQDEETGKLLDNIKDFTDISYVDDLKYNDNNCDILIHVYDAKTHEEVNTGAFNYAPSYDGNSGRIS